MSNENGNRLINEKSPYLLQHAYNPVNWYPWCEEAFEKAEKENKPIFLSIGYSTCHWCHVMERESFEDNEVANVLNENFISIKVDREERPDIDTIYMDTCQLLTGHGGWPLTIFALPNKKPFYAGTYFPKEDTQYMNGLITLLNKIIGIWENSKDKVLESANEIVKTLHYMTEFGEVKTDNSNKVNVKSEFLKDAFYTFKSSFDSKYGGFGDKPKFPTPHNLWFLLEYYKATNDTEALNMVEITLDAMYAGGIYDHIGFGFSRYSTDRFWLVPHFEKMLYDNALLAILYSKAHEITKKEKYKSVANEIFTYLLRDMHDEKGGFYSAEDADSEGIEGKFYVWSLDEIYQVLGKDDGEKFASYFNITEKGNFEGFNIPNLINKTLPEDTEFINRCKQKLFNYRNKRIHPYKDDKILTSWNGLAIAAFALGGRLLHNNEYTLAAESALEFVYKYLFNEDGKLLARYREGEAKIYGYADDYAFLTWALLELYEDTNKEIFLGRAIDLTSDFVKYFWDDEKDGFFLYGSHGEQLITRPKKIYDGAIPSGNSVAALNFLKLYKFTSNMEYLNKAGTIFDSFSNEVSQHPSAYCFLLLSMIFYEKLQTP
ncbi:thioredoxin domain-containing protein [Clostridium sp. UBA1056]|uniref:thioredoxin domain-containing protein n=1 Tax=unclassified Clostridium TaxID=2614128 RepID=UPI0032177F4E